MFAVRRNKTWYGCAFDAGAEGKGSGLSPLTHAYAVGGPSVISLPALHCNTGTTRVGAGNHSTSSPPQSSVSCMPHTSVLPTIGMVDIPYLLFPDVRSDSHPVGEVGPHVKLLLDPLRPCIGQDTVVCIGKCHHLPGHPPKPIWSRFLPG